MQWLKWSFSSYLRDVELSALGFIALGLRERRAVAVMGFNAPEWFFADLGDMMRHLDSGLPTPRNKEMPYLW